LDEAGVRSAHQGENSRGDAHVATSNRLQSVELRTGTFVELGGAIQRTT